jgi:hypothetical protein
MIYLSPARARSVHLPRRAFAKPEKLFQVMLPMRQMKLSPLRGTQRAQNRMVEQRDPTRGFVLRAQPLCAH